MFTSEKPMNRFLDLSLAVFSMNELLIIAALALFKDMVFLLALFYSKEQSSMKLVPVEETPRASIVEETSAKFLMKSEFLMLNRD